MYGPVRTVVWQGSAGDRRPYADLTAYSEVTKAIVTLAFGNGPIEDIHAGRSCPLCSGKSEYS